jgi:hypothetical protein
VAQGERYRDPVTGDLSDPDPTLLSASRDLLGQKRRRVSWHDQHRGGVRDRPSADHSNPGRYPRYLEQLKEAYFLEHRGRIATLIGIFATLLSDAEQTWPRPGLRARPSRRAR